MRNVAVWQGFVLALVSSATAPAWGALAENLGVSSTAMSLGNAVTADPPGIDAIHFNPAGLANLEGDRSSKSFFGALISGWSRFHQPEGYGVGGFSQDPVAGRQGGPLRGTIIIPGVGPLKKGLPFLIGASAGWSWNVPGSGVTFANAIYPVMGLGYARPEEDDPARYGASYLALQRIALASPAVGFKVSDTFKVGLSVPITYTEVAAALDARTPNVLIGMVGQVQKGFCPDNGSNPLDVFLFGLCSKGRNISPYDTQAKVSLRASAPVDLTYNVGALWEPTRWATLGATYRSGSRVRLNGRYSIEVSENLRALTSGLYGSLLGPVAGALFSVPQNIPPVLEGGLQLVLPIPAVLQLGLALRPTPGVQFSMDATRASWGEINNVRLQLDAPINLLDMARIAGVSDSSQVDFPRGYVSRWHLGFGLKWQVDDRLQLRFGYEPRKSSIPPDKIDLIAPLGDMKVYSAGISWRFDDYELAANLSQATTSFHAPANTSCNLNCTNFQNFIYNPYAGLDVSGGLRFWMGGITINRRF